MAHPTRTASDASSALKRRRAAFIFVALLVAGLVSPILAEEDVSPCQGSLDALGEAYEADERTRAAFQATYEGLKPLPPGYEYNGSGENPWKASSEDGAGLVRQVIGFYKEVCTLLPRIIGTNDNALDSIQYFAWMYYHNEAGRRMVEGVDPNDPARRLDSVKDFLIQFNEEYKHYMSSPASQKVVKEWIADPRLEIQDYVKTKASEYRSWNEFFARNLKKGPDGGYPSRPVTMADRDYVVVSPTDCIMNPLVQVLKTRSGDVSRRLIENPLQKDTVLDVKGIPISVSDLLGNAPENLKDKFKGGSGLACVLMPNTYHHFHSPVDGHIRYAEIVEAGSNPYAWGTFGYDDWPNWVPLDGNVGRPGTDFSQFQGFQRGVIIIEVKYDNLPGREPKKLTGYVASIPVGLDTVGSVAFHKGVEPGAKVTKGNTPFGYFVFGGSLDILLFSPTEGFSAQMLSPAVQTRMGNQIGILNTPYPAPSTPWVPGAGRSRDRKVRHPE